jgi:hypothetical protein
MKTLIASATLLFAATAFAAGAPNLTGKWQLHQNIAGHESDQNCSFVQSDAALTGTCKGTGQDDKDVQIKGSVDADKLTFQYETDYNGTPLTMKFTAPLNDSGKLVGTVTIDPFNVSGDFKVTRSSSDAK